MKTLQVPTFDEFNHLKFIGFKKVKVKNKMNTKDYHKITAVLPGMVVGYCPEIYDIAKTKKPIEIIHFYDIKQRDVKKLKGYYITILNNDK